jgi:hypothetical protein
MVMPTTTSGINCMSVYGSGQRVKLWYVLSSHWQVPVSDLLYAEVAVFEE